MMAMNRQGGRAASIPRVLVLLAFLLVPVLVLAGGKDDDLAIVYPPEQLVFARTADGWDLSIVHFEPAGYGGSPRMDALPLLLVHGLTSTSITWHLGGEEGLAPHLARAGFDVWAANLRGEREGSRPTKENGLSWGWTFEDYLHQDLPAIVEKVLSETGRDRIVWIGHSMGGMLLYTYLQAHGDAQIRAGITIGTPMEFSHARGDGMLRMGALLAPWYEGRKRVRAERTARWIARHCDLDGRLADRFSRTAANPDNFPPRTRRLYLYNSLPDLSAPLLLEFQRAAETGRLVDSRTGKNYVAGLSEIRIPLLILCGEGDRLAPPAATRVAFDRVSSADKTWVNFSRRDGYAHDYGHGDLVLGTTAPQEVYPVILEWVAAHSGPGSPAE